MPYSVFVYRIISKWMAMSDGYQIRREDILEERTAHELEI